MEAIRPPGFDRSILKSQDRCQYLRQGRRRRRTASLRFRHTMLEDTDSSRVATRHARAAVGGLIGGVAGTGLVYVSGGAEHQGPAGLAAADRGDRPKMSKK